jgi:hypothetical protein
MQEVRMFRKLRRKIFRLAVVSGAGAAATWFLDPDRGVERREQAKGKANSLLKRGGGTPVADWQSSAANGFATPATATSTPSAPATAAPTTTSTAGDVTGTAPIDVLIVEERAVGQ